MVRLYVGVAAVVVNVSAVALAAADTVAAVSGNVVADDSISVAIVTSYSMADVTKAIHETVVNLIS